LTLVEMMVSVMVLAVGLLGLGAAARRGRRSNP
jgi:MYXO-CTERM domain-containing protein